MKFRLGMRLIWNVFRISVLKMLYFGRLSGSVIQLLSPRAGMQVGTKSRIELRGRVNAEPGVYISVADGGQLICGKMFINRNSMIVCRDQISIGDGTTIGPNVVIYDHDHDIHRRGKLVKVPVVIGKNVWIGAGCTILKGVTIGDNCVIAAGTVVTKDVPANTVIRTKFTYAFKDIEGNV